MLLRNMDCQRWLLFNKPVSVPFKKLTGQRAVVLASRWFELKKREAGASVSVGLEIAKPFIGATVNVLGTMAGIKPVVGKPYIKNENEAKGDISAIVGVMGDYSGSISLSFSRSCALALVKGMLGDDIEDVMRDTADAVGEITNMISGQSRAGLTEHGIHLQGSTPTIIFGDKHSIMHMAKVSIVAIPFTTDHGAFCLEFCLEKS